MALCPIRLNVIEVALHGLVPPSLRGGARRGVPAFSNESPIKRKSRSLAAEASLHVFAQHDIEVSIVGDSGGRVLDG